MQLVNVLTHLRARIDSIESERGQTMAEYAVVLAVITLAIIAALTLLAGGISTALGNVTKTL